MNTPDSNATNRTSRHMALAMVFIAIGASNAFAKESHQLSAICADEQQAELCCRSDRMGCLQKGNSIPEIKKDLRLKYFKNFKGFCDSPTGGEGGLACGLVSVESEDSKEQMVYAGKSCAFGLQQMCLSKMIHEANFARKSEDYEAFESFMKTLNGFCKEKQNAGLCEKEPEGPAISALRRAQQTRAKAAKKDASICSCRRLEEITSKQLDREKDISSVSGVVNKSAMYNLGKSLLGIRDTIKKLEMERSGSAGVAKCESRISDSEASAVCLEEIARLYRQQYE